MVATDKHIFSQMGIFADALLAVGTLSDEHAFEYGIKPASPVSRVLEETFAGYNDTHAQNGRERCEEGPHNAYICNSANNEAGFLEQRRHLRISYCVGACKRAGLACVCMKCYLAAGTALRHVATHGSRPRTPHTILETLGVQRLEGSLLASFQPLYAFIPGGLFSS